MYWHRGNIKIMKQEAKDLREEINDIITLMNIKGYFKHDIPLQVNVDIHENWLTKENKVAKKDISNREKFLIDSVFKSLDIDDKYIFKHTARKINSDVEKAVITIEVYDEE